MTNGSRHNEAAATIRAAIEEQFDEEQAENAGATALIAVAHATLAVERAIQQMAVALVASSDRVAAAVAALGSSDTDSETRTG